MEQDKLQIARLVKNGRLAKGYTQQELAEQTNISLRSIQRIENGEVVARMYTLKMLADALEIEFPVAEEKLTSKTVLVESEPLFNNWRGRKLLLAVLWGSSLLLFSAAFLSQAPTFPETSFELFTFWGCVVSFYLIILTRVIKV